MADERRPTERGRVVQLRVLDKPDREMEILTKEKLAELKKATGGHVLAAAPTKASAERMAKTRAMDREVFAKEFAEDKELVKWATTESKYFGPNGPQLRVKGAEGKPHAVRLINPESFVRDMVMMKRYLDAPVYALHHYTALHSGAHRRIKRMPAYKADKVLAEFKKFPDPIEFQKDPEATIVEVGKLRFRLIEWILDWLGGDDDDDDAPGTPAPPANCGLEEGTGFGGDDGVQGAAPSLNPDGLLANNDWPLKPFTTCVRDQGGRGTCVSFGVTAAVEAVIAAQEGRWMNLSEQDLYMHQKLHWFPIPPDWYGDGYNAMYSVLLQTLVTDYTFPLEVHWDYNKSLSRDEFDVQREYANSCVGYNGEACSDTNHQAELIGCYGIPEVEILEEDVEHCVWEPTPLSEQTGIGGWFGNALDWVQDQVTSAGEWICETVTEVTEIITGWLELCEYDTDIAGTSGFGISGSVPLWVRTWTSAGDWANVKSHLNLQHPVVFCYKVVASFSNHDGGYVSYDPDEDAVNDDGDPAGGHCSVITGYVDNANLPAGAPAGAGGGYFIVKNSWGVWNGDDGYYYVPYDWAQRWGTGMIAVTEVS